MVGLENLGNARAGAWALEQAAYAEYQGDAYRPVGEGVRINNLDAEIAMTEASLAARTRQLGLVTELAAPAAVADEAQIAA